METVGLPSSDTSFLTPAIVERSRKEYELKFSEDPLSTPPTVQWDQITKDAYLLDQIEKDASRTRPSMSFFSKDDPNCFEHYRSLVRILFIYAKLNPGIAYVQGMNEVLAVLLYVFASCPPGDDRDNAEADSFFCFTSLMSEIMDNFCVSLDHSGLGVNMVMDKMKETLKMNDSELFDEMEKKAIHPQFYSFRWITLLLTQEFEMPEVIRLWDSLLSQEGRIKFIVSCCCSMLMIVKDKLITTEFAENLSILQHYPVTDVRKIIKLAEKLKNNFPVPPRHVKDTPSGISIPIAKSESEGKRVASLSLGASPKEYPSEFKEFKLQRMHNSEQDTNENSDEDVTSDFQ
eukprot:TRINITY_DN10254_c0_g1_i2.p1 TRINITY_DN10254_c0_g1~~TRINITY_DN10254_c0_g1_i2.p1  ORF type:complete len:346 (-),score=54.52 TRINITY_DN10254_c0_g1_i2:17-1054(-)